MKILIEIEENIEQSDLDGIQLWLENKFNLTVQSIKVIE